MNNLIKWPRRAVKAVAYLEADKTMDDTDDLIKKARYDAKQYDKDGNWLQARLLNGLANALEAAQVEIIRAHQDAEDMAGKCLRQRAVIKAAQNHCFGSNGTFSHTHRVLCKALKALTGSGGRRID